MSIVVASYQRDLLHCIVEIFVELDLNGPYLCVIEKGYSH